MRKSLSIFGRLAAVMILVVLPATGCPSAGGKPGGKLLPLASERVRVVFHEDTEMTGEASQNEVGVSASGIWSPGGTDIVIDINNTSGEAVRVDFREVKLAKTGQPPAAVVLVVEYVGGGDKQQTVFLYERGKTPESESAAATVVSVASGARRRLQAGFRYQSADNPGGKIGDQATLEVPVQRAAERQPDLFKFAFEYKGR